MDEKQMLNLLSENRSYRRFGSRRVSMREMTVLVEAARLSPSAGNLQQLRFLPVTDEAMCASIFSCLGWAGYLKDWDGAAEGERPTGYILFLCSPDVAKTWTVAADCGIAVQSMLLEARTMGLGGCILRNVNRQRLAEILGDVGQSYEVPLILALGEPIEQVRLVPLRDGDVKYFRDAQGIHYVPKRSTEELMVSLPGAEVGEPETL